MMCNIRLTNAERRTLETMASAAGVSQEEMLERIVKSKIKEVANMGKRVWRDGWHKMYRWQVYTEDNRIVLARENNGTPVDTCIMQEGEAIPVLWMTYEAFRSAFRAGRADFRHKRVDRPAKPLYDLDDHD